MSKMQDEVYEKATEEFIDIGLDSGVVKRRVPAQKPGRSEQVVATPKDFLDAVKNKLRIDDFYWDLAADENNTVIKDGFFNEEDNALVQTWHVLPGWLWCNPPFADIEPWVNKAADEAMDGAHIAMLVPASVGSNWWNYHVHDEAYVYFTSPRVTFVGHKHPYPKDLALLLYTPLRAKGYECWRWK